MSHSKVISKISKLLNRDGISFKAEVATFSVQGEVKKGPVFVGDFSKDEVDRIKSYLDLADYFSRTWFHPESSDIVVAGDGILIGYVNDFDADIDYEF